MKQGKLNKQTVHIAMLLFKNDKGLHKFRRRLMTIALFGMCIDLASILGIQTIFLFDDHLKIMFNQFFHVSETSGSLAAAVSTLLHRTTEVVEGTE